MIELSKYSSINDYSINLEKSNQLLPKPIYSLRPIELEIFKTYIKINLANSFIYLIKSSVKVFILFVKKLNNNYRFYIDDKGLNYLIIKNWYIFLLISKLFN